MWEIMSACVITHKMIIESESDIGFTTRGHLSTTARRAAQICAISRHASKIHDGEAHDYLQCDLFMHLWARYVGEGDGEQDPEAL